MLDIYIFFSFFQQKACDIYRNTFSEQFGSNSSGAKYFEVMPWYFIIEIVFFITVW